jgi:SAM-dependent methyltransferase
MAHIVKKILNILRKRGIVGLMSAVFFRLTHLLPIRAESFHNVESLLRDKNGIEIGGPSQVFTARGIFPVYPIAGHLDNCNFGGTTVWEGDIKEGQSFQFDRDKPVGRQYIVEATAMECIPSASYDFVLSSHALEHMANPILALSEWIRLLKDQGTLVVLLPHKDGTFDHRRPVTTMQHLIADFNVGMTEDDLTHMPEIMALHDLERDPEAGDLDAFKKRSSHNFENRCFHQHVFDTHLVIKLIDHMGLQIRTVEVIRPMHILVVAQKVKREELVDNSAYTGESAQYRQRSPFLSDRLSVAGSNE